MVSCKIPYSRTEPVKLGEFADLLMPTNISASKSVIQRQGTADQLGDGEQEKHFDRCRVGPAAAASLSSWQPRGLAESLPTAAIFGPVASVVSTSNIYGKAMQVEASYPAAQIILSQIAARQQVTEGFERVFADYQRALQNCTVYQVISRSFSSPVHNPRIVVYRS